MDILINGEKADITLETEKTIGDLLMGFNNWLIGTRNNSQGNAQFRLSGLVIDGIPTHAQSLKDAFSRQLSTINTIDIQIASVYELLYTALGETLDAVDAWGNTEFSAKQDFLAGWKLCPAAVFLTEQSPDLYDMTVRTFSGESPGAAILSGIINERLRELENPAAELDSMGPIIDDTASRLENLPLDFQTGKDRQASETIQLFTGIMEKMFRMLNLVNTGTNLSDFLSEFNSALKEMLSAYERKDTVVAGDLAEYEMAPRLRSFYSALKAPVDA
jgi:hypothetical protein